MFFYSGNKEIPLKNRYDVLSELDVGDEETHTDQHGCLYSFSNCANCLNCLNFDFDYPNCIICLNSINNNDVFDSNVLNDINSNNEYSYDCIRENKHFCSGYFPSFITISNPKYDLISQNSHSGNISNNYYLKIKNGRYLKQISNENSKYNIGYQNNMKAICQSIKNKHFNKTTSNTYYIKSNSCINNNSPLTGLSTQKVT